MALTKEKKTAIIKDFARDEKDTGSPEVQIAILTEEINKLTEQGYINDEILSKYILDDVIRNKKGPKCLENKLKLKGIESKINNLTQNNTKINVIITRKQIKHIYKHKMM